MLYIRTHYDERAKVPPFFLLYRVPLDRRCVHVWYCCQIRDLLTVESYEEMCSNSFSFFLQGKKEKQSCFVFFNHWNSVHDPFSSTLPLQARSKSDVSKIEACERPFLNVFPSEHDLPKEEKYTNVRRQGSVQKKKRRRRRKERENLCADRKTKMKRANKSKRCL